MAVKAVFMDGIKYVGNKIPIRNRREVAVLKKMPFPRIAKQYYLTTNDLQMGWVVFFSIIPINIHYHKGLNFF